jgi:hypothetical protein
MSAKPRWCACPCHKDVSCHTAPRCTCGGKIVDPWHCPPEPPHCHKPKCPPPKTEPEPGTVNLPHPPPPHFPTAPQPPWKVGKPPAGDLGEIPWFRGTAGGIAFRGPKFGPRKDEFLPYLLVRSAAGDRGRRPVTGVFWESPDIYVTPNQPADTAPLLPATLGGLAAAGAPNTLYAHVWNLGKAPAGRLRVEFYWFNPALGLSRANANLIGAAYIDLQNRFSLGADWRPVEGPSVAYLTKGSHAIVRCPTTWVPRFENGGHECLVVRAFEPFLDAVAHDQFSCVADRHVAQRNITVVQAASPAEIDIALDLGYLEQPADVVIDLKVEPPSTMAWLRLFDPGGPPPVAPPAGAVVAGLLPAGVPEAPFPRLAEIDFDCRGPLLTPRQALHRGCDPLRIGVHASAKNLEPGQAQVVRVRQTLATDVIGGYTVVLTGPHARP